MMTADSGKIYVQSVYKSRKYENFYAMLLIIILYLKF